MWTDEDLAGALRIGYVIVDRLGKSRPSLRDELESEMYVAVMEALDSWHNDRNATRATWAFNVINWRLRDFMRRWTPGLRNGNQLYVTSLDRIMMRYGRGTFDTVVDLRQSEPALDIEDDTAAILQMIESVLDQMNPKHARITRIWLRGYTLREAGATEGVTEAMGCRVIKDFRARLKGQLAKCEIYV